MYCSGERCGPGDLLFTLFKSNYISIKAVFIKFLRVVHSDFTLETNCN